MTKLSYSASSEHVICVRFIPFWTFNSWITGGVGTAPGGVRTTVASGRFLVGPLKSDSSQKYHTYLRHARIYINVQYSSVRKTGTS